VRKQKPCERQRSWEPKLGPGGLYCSPACGRGCTKAQHDKVWGDAERLAKRMGPGWHPGVWENLGWHGRIEYGPAEIRAYPKRGRFPKSYHSHIQITGIHDICTEAKTPELAFAMGLDQVRAVANRTKSVVNQLTKWAMRRAR
jgi:hypothetical protein